MGERPQTAAKRSIGDAGWVVAGCQSADSPWVNASARPNGSNGLAPSFVLAGDGSHHGWKKSDMPAAIDAGGVIIGMGKFNEFRAVGRPHMDIQASIGFGVGGRYQDF